MASPPRMVPFLVVMCLPCFDAGASLTCRGSWPMFLLRLSMSAAPLYLQNSEAVLRAFGYWPSFHDAPVMAFRYAAGSGSGVELVLHGSELTRDWTRGGRFEAIKHHLVRFAFHDIADEELTGFEPENVLFGLEFSSAEEFAATGKFKVTLDSAIGGDLSGSFSARAGEVVEVVPCDAEGRKTEPGTPPN